MQWMCHPRQAGELRGLFPLDGKIPKARDAGLRRKVRAALFGEYRALAAAYIHQEAQRKRKVAARRKITNGLGAAIFGESEIVLGQIADQLTLFVANGYQDVDYLDGGGEGRVLRASERTHRARGYEDSLSAGWGHHLQYLTVISVAGADG